MDIYETLKKDHSEVEELIKQVLSSTSPAQREELFEKISNALTIHAETEEATFYAALERQNETREIIDHAQEDQDEIKEYLHKLSILIPENQNWLELFGEFKQAVEHHVKDEEERIFPIAQKLLSDAQADELGKQMSELKIVTEYIAA